MSTGFGPPPERARPGQRPQPGYGAAANPAGYAPAAYQPGGGTGRNPAGRVALAAGVVVVVVGLVRQCIAYVLPYVLDHSDLSVATTYQIVGLIGGAVTVAIALVALIAGGIALSGSGKPKGAAAAGFALGAAALLTALFDLVGPMLAQLLL